MVVKKISDLLEPLFKIRPEPDQDLFFKSVSGRIRIQSKNGRIRPDPEPDLGSGRSLLVKWPKNFELNTVNFVTS